MSSPFVAEIRIFGFNFSPVGWALCNGQLMGIAQNTALFSLLGTFYGGNGTSNFALPDLQGRGAMATGQGPGQVDRNLGESGGTASVTLIPQELPPHGHAVNVTVAPADRANATGNMLGIPADATYATGAQVQMSPFSTLPAGGNLPHNNMQPYLVMNFCIALQGIYPSRP